MNRLYLGCGVLLAAALGWATWQALRPPAREPVYNGKSVSAWLNDLDPKTGKLSASAVDALQHLATNAVPRLLKETRWSFPIKGIANHLLDKQSIVGFRFARGPDHEVIAQQGFRCLGTTGAMAVAQGLTNSDRWIRFGCVAQWELCKDYPDILFQPLFNCLRDPETRVRGRAANALGMLRQKPEQVVPVLTAMLSDPDVRSMAALGLGCYGDQAKSAFPVLLKMFNAPLDNETEEEVAYALRRIDPAALLRIDPAAAAKAGIHVSSP